MTLTLLGRKGGTRSAHCDWKWWQWSILVCNCCWSISNHSSFHYKRCLSRPKEIWIFVSLALGAAMILAVVNGFSGHESEFWTFSHELLQVEKFNKYEWYSLPPSKWNLMPRCDNALTFKANSVSLSLTGCHFPGTYTLYWQCSFPNKHSRGSKRHKTSRMVWVLWTSTSQMLRLYNELELLDVCSDDVWAPGPCTKIV